MSLRATSKYEIICYSLYLNIGMPTSKTFLTQFFELVNGSCASGISLGGVVKCNCLKRCNSIGLIGGACQLTNMWPMELHYFSVFIVRILRISYSGGIGKYKDYFCIHY